MCSKVKRCVSQVSTSVEERRIAGVESGAAVILGVKSVDQRISNLVGVAEM
jgi:hypothetical protein